MEDHDRQYHLRQSSLSCITLLFMATFSFAMFTDDARRATADYFYVDADAGLPAPQHAIQIRQHERVAATLPPTP